MRVLILSDRAVESNFLTQRLTNFKENFIILT